jgi:hypothetical protein
MASQQAKFIKVPVAEGTIQTMPVDEAKRLAESDIRIEIADEKDAYQVVSHRAFLLLGRPQL